MHLPPDVEMQLLRGTHPGMVSHYENHADHDLIQLRIPPPLVPGTEGAVFSIYLSAQLLFVLYPPWSGMDSLFQDLEERLGENPSPARTAVFLLDHLSRGDALVLQGLEEEITELEDALLSTTKNRDYLPAIMGFRRRLLALKRYYEQLVDLFDALVENENALAAEGELRYLGNIAKRIDRLHYGVLNLRDYVTQVREAYQSQEDIHLNNIMKLFTVITAICLPITMIAGWYGMNLQMPEYHWVFGYPLIIGVCLLVVGICMCWFKKNKWF